MSAKQIVEDAIAGNKIVIFSKSYCPYCKRAKNLLTSDFAHIKDQIYVKELDEAPDGRAIQDYLLEKTSQSTVPNIFINKKHVGGCDRLESLKSQGELAVLVDAAT